MSISLSNAHDQTELIEIDQASPLIKIQHNATQASSKVAGAAKAISRIAIRCITLPFVLLTSATIMAAQIAILSIAALPMLILLSPFLLILSTAAAVTGIAFAAIFIPPLLIGAALIS